MRPCIVAFIYVELHVSLIYILGACGGKIFLEFFTPKGTVLDKELSLLPLPLSDSQNNASDLVVF